MVSHDRLKWKDHDDYRSLWKIVPQAMQRFQTISIWKYRAKATNHRVLFARLANLSGRCKRNSFAPKSWQQKTSRNQTTTIFGRFLVHARYLGSWCIKATEEFLTRVDAPLQYLRSVVTTSFVEFLAGDSWLSTCPICGPLDFKGPFPLKRSSYNSLLNGRTWRSSTNQNMQ